MDFRRARTRTVFPSAVNGNMFASLKVDLERQVISRWLPTGVRPRNDRLQYEATFPEYPWMSQLQQLWTFPSLQSYFNYRPIPIIQHKQNRKFIIVGYTDEPNQGISTVEQHTCFMPVSIMR
jgi:hypothetical protein